MPLVGWLLLFAVVVAIGYVLFRRRQSARRPSLRLPEVPDEDNLTSLGLSEVRVAAPAAARTTEEAPDPAREFDAPRPEPVATPDDAPRPARSREEETRPPAEAPAPAARAAPPDEPAARLRPGAELWAGGEAAVSHLLASLAAHVHGTAAVLRAEGDHYAIEGLAGDGDDLPESTDGGPLDRVPQDDLLTVLPEALGPLADLVGGPRAYARALAPEPAPRVYLVVGTDQTDDDPVAVAQLERYADLLASLVDLGDGDPQDEVDASAEADASAENGAPVPRAVLIADEQEAAAAAGRPLAFALVTLADAEKLLEAGGPDLSAAQAALRQRLEDAPHAQRVEPFGDLLVGVFLDLEPGPMAAWCDDLASGDPPVFIGAVAPADGDAGAVRDAAAEALQDAYRHRTAQVVAVD